MRVAEQVFHGSHHCQLVSVLVPRHGWMAVLDVACGDVPQGSECSGNRQ